jgi:hypothetical protein
VKKTRTRTDRRLFEEWARRALQGVKESATFLQIYNAKFDPYEDPAYALQLGAAILLDRPIVIITPEGTTVPPKLAAIASSLQFYVPDDQESMYLATRRGLEAVGAVTH